jgi:hypothetical protein
MIERVDDMPAGTIVFAPRASSPAMTPPRLEPVLDDAADQSDADRDPPPPLKPRHHQRGQSNHQAPRGVRRRREAINADSSRASSSRTSGSTKTRVVAVQPKPPFLAFRLSASRITSEVVVPSAFARSSSWSRSSGSSLSGLDARGRRT